MKHILPVLCLLAVLLGACLPQTSTPSLPSPTPEHPNVTPTQPEPSATATAAPAPTASATALVPTATSAAVLPPTPLRTPTASKQFLPLLTSAQIVPDCARLPGFPGCGPALPLNGRLAIFDPTRQVIDLADYRTRQNWQVKAPAGMKSISWRSQGSFLLAFDDKNQPALAWADPASSKTVLPDALSPQGTPVFTADDGSSAWLETTKDGAYLYHVLRAGSSKEQTWPAEPSPSDKIHELLGWVPGSSLLLGGYHFGANSMWLTGNRLYTLDTHTGATQEMPANLRLGGTFQWHPSQAGLMLFGNSDQSPIMGAPRPAVLDVLTAKVTPLISDSSVSAATLSWARGGLAVLFAASKVGETAKAGDPFAAAAVYYTEWPVKTVRALTKPGAGERDEWPQLTPDGKLFLYMRSSGEGKPAELRLAALDGSLDTRLASGISAPPASPGNTHWETVIAYTPAQ